MLKEKHDIAQFIYEELQLAPWYLTGEFIDVHKKSEGSGMMQLSGLGDPSGFGEGFSFLRKVDNKPAKAAAATNNELNAHVKKITVSFATSLGVYFCVCKLTIGNFRRSCAPLCFPVSTGNRR